MDVRETMQAYLQARAAQEGEWQALWRARLGGYFTADYAERVFATQRRWQARSEVEDLYEIREAGDEATVLSTGAGSGERKYLLRRDGDGWRIADVKLRCDCRGGDPACGACGGEGWREGGG